MKTKSFSSEVQELIEFYETVTESKDYELIHLQVFNHLKAYLCIIVFNHYNIGNDGVPFEDELKEARDYVDTLKREQIESPEMIIYMTAQLDLIETLEKEFNS